MPVLYKKWTLYSVNDGKSEHGALRAEVNIDHREALLLWLLQPVLLLQLWDIQEVPQLPTILEAENS